MKMRNTCTELQKIFCLDLGAGYVGVYMCVTSTSCVIKVISLCCMQLYLNLKKCTQNEIHYMRRLIKMKGYTHIRHVRTLLLGGMMGIKGMNE